MKTFQCLTIVGVGLIGGSVGLAVRKAGLAARIVGTGSRAQTLEKAKRVGAIDEAIVEPKAAVADADLVLIGAPVGLVAELVDQLAPRCAPGTLITDVGSTKREIVEQLERQRTGWPEGVEFIGSHPLAGNEKTGPDHASATLFDGKTVVLTPTASSTPEAVKKLTEFWQQLGARVLEMSAGSHDQALAATSHLPHLVAAAVVSATPEEYVTLTASGWQDTTRIASGDPGLWRQIMLANRTNLLASLAGYEGRLAAWRAALETADGAKLEQLLSEAKRIRDAAGN